MSTPLTLPALLHTFFQDYLVRERNVSAHTVRSYRDTWKLFLRFAADRQHRPVARLVLADLAVAEVRAFLDHLERDRHAGIGTRNCRLAALRSFYAFVSTSEPSAVAQCAAILSIRTKRRSIGPPTSMEPDEIDAVLAQPDRTRPEGFRDHVLFSFLYNTGARIQEALDVRPQDLRLGSPACVRLMGKGRKERLCPLWSETVALLRDLLKRQPRPSDQPIFVNRYGQPLGASGVRFKLAQCVAAAAQGSRSLVGKRITPHTFRHSTAVSLVSAGENVTVIAHWLGHASLDTTNWYARANLNTKRAALDKVDPPATRRPPRWKRDTDLLAWLETL